MAVTNTVFPATKSVSIGEAVHLTVTIYPENTTDQVILWSSSNPNVASVNSAGKVVAKSVGSAIITATNFNTGISGQSVVTVVGFDLFDTSKVDCLKAEFISLLGEKKENIPVLDLYYIRTTSECIDVIVDNDSLITRYANCIGLPKSFVQTILMRELLCLNQADALGDEMVENYFAWKEACEYWENQDVLYQATVEYPSSPVPLKTDSSVGLGQIFAYVAINAYNEAIDYGYVEGTKIDVNNWKECKNVWYSLRDNDEYNVKMSTLNITSCVNEYGYDYNYQTYTAEQCKQVFTRYNAEQDTVNDYGEECYQYYLIFEAYL